MLEASTLFILTLGGVGLNEIPNFFYWGERGAFVSAFSINLNRSSSKA